MTSTPDDRAPEPPEVPGPPPVQDPPVPGVADTQPITAGLADTQPLTWAAPAVPVAPSPYGQVPPVGGQPYGNQPPAAGQPPYGTPPPPPAGRPGYGPPGYGPPAPGAPGYGAPGYGAAGYGAPGQPYGAALPPNDALAVASLVTSAAGLVLLAGATGPVGIGLGIGGLARIRRTGARGRGLAIAGIVVGAVGTVVFGLVVWMVVAIAQLSTSVAEDALGGQDLDQLLEDLEGSSGGSSSEDLDGLFGDLEEQLEGLAEPTPEALPESLPPYALPQDVTAGTCWELMPEYYDLSDAVPVPCSQEHDAEVVAVLTATGAPATDLTVDDPVLTAAYEQCDAAVSAIDPGLLVWGSADVWLPHPDQVAAGQLVGYCVYEDLLGTTESLVAPAGMSS